MPCPLGTDVRRAAALLRDGKLVAFATETVYGLGGHALDPQAVARIFEAKERPRFDPLIVHVAERSQLAGLVRDMPATARALADRFWPGPLTLVLPKQDVVPDLVTAGLPNVAVRIPDHPLALELLRTAGVPVAAPSANPFGRISPTRAEHVAEQLGDRIDYILDGGPCRVGLESTVLHLAGDVPVLLRPGGLPVEEIEPVIGRVARPEVDRTRDDVAQLAPGMHSKHYAPRTPLVIVERVSSPGSTAGGGSRVGLLTFKAVPEADRFTAVEVVAPDGQLATAAANFFAALRRLDALRLDRIVATSFPEEGLGRALNDRLRRAAQ